MKEKVFDGIISVVGLGYVGMPLAVEFAKKYHVIGFDVNVEKIIQYQKGIDLTSEVGDRALKNTSVEFTYDPMRLKEAKFHIIAVPTPINFDKTPDLTPVINASRILGENITAGSTVVYESTVYPGVTEDICIPVIEEASGLRCGVDFKVGYSPERINPGDQVHRLINIKKVVSGMDKETLELIASVYGSIITAGVHRAPSIKVAEAAKVVENSQRDINIAFMNELAMVFDKMRIDTQDVITAMNTKWNALGFAPGLVGGHCIGVDPYYFIYEAEKLGYHSQIILSGRKVNDSMGQFVAQTIIKKLVQTGKVVRDAKVLMLGLTFKEDCPDLRNTKVIDIVNVLKEYDITPTVVDPIADAKTAKSVYGIDIKCRPNKKSADCVVVAVAHQQYKKMSIEQIESLFREVPNSQRVIIDIKGIWDKQALCEKGYQFWRL